MCFRKHLESVLEVDLQGGFVAEGYFVDWQPKDRSEPLYDEDWSGRGRPKLSRLPRIRKHLGIFYLGSTLTIGRRRIRPKSTDL